MKSWGGNLNERELAEAAADLDLDLAFGHGAEEARRPGHRRQHLRHLHHRPRHAGPQSAAEPAARARCRRAACACRSSSAARASRRARARMCGPSAWTCFPPSPNWRVSASRCRRASKAAASLPVLTSGGSGVVQRPREEYVVHFPHYDKDAIGPASGDPPRRLQAHPRLRDRRAAAVRHRQRPRRTPRPRAARCRTRRRNSTSG